MSENVKVQDGYITRANVARRLAEKIERLEREFNLDASTEILGLLCFLHDVGLLPDKEYAVLDDRVVGIMHRDYEEYKAGLREENEQNELRRNTCGDSPEV